MPSDFFSDYIASVGAASPPPSGPAPREEKKPKPVDFFSDYIQSGVSDLEAARAAKLEQIQQATAHGNEQAAALGLDQPPPGLMEQVGSVGRSMVTGGQQLLGGVGTALEAAGQGMQQPGIPGGALAGVPLEAIGQVLSQGAEAYQRNAYPEIQRGQEIAQQAPVTGFAQDVAAQVPQLALAAGMGGGAPALAALGAASGGQAIQQAEQEGATPAEALTYGVTSGAIEAATERFGKLPVVNKMLQRAITGEVVKGGAVKRVLKDVAANFGEEAAAQVGQRVAALQTYDEKGSFGAKDFQDAVYAGLIGAVVAGVPSAAAEIGGRPPAQAPPPTPAPVQEAAPPPPAAPEPIRVPEVAPLPPQPEIVPVEAAPAPTPPPAQPAPLPKEAPRGEEAQAEPVRQPGPDVAPAAAPAAPVAQAEVGRPAPAVLTEAPRVEEPAAPGPAPLPSREEPAPAAVPTAEPATRGMAASQTAPTLTIPTNLAPPTKATTPIGTAHVNEALAYIWNVPIRYKHFRKRALGIFKVRPEVVRLKGEGNIAATAHEVAHFLDKQNPAYRSTAPAGGESELIALGKALYGGKHNNDFYASEGFAEYMRLRLSRDDAATQAPEFDRHFEAMVAQDPALQKKLSDSKAVYDRWRQQAPIERAKGQIDFESEMGKPTAKQRVADAGRAVVSGMIDSWAPVDQATQALVEKAGLRRKDLPAKHDPYRILAAYEGSEASIAKHMMLEGVRDAKGDLIAPSVKEALAKVEAQDYRDFFAYALAKRTVELAGRQKPTGLSVEDAKALIASHETPEWQEAARGLNAYANGLVDVLHDSGALTSEQAAKVKESEWYIPLTRVYEVEAGGALASSYPGKAGQGVGAPLKSLTGSERPIQDPLLSLAQLTERVVGASTKSRVFRALYNLQAAVAGAGDILEEVDAPLKSNSLSLDQIRKQLEDLGVEVPEDADGDAILTVFSNASMPKGADPIVSGVVDGKRKFLFVKDPYLYASLSNLPSAWQQAVNKLWPIQKLASSVRLGATGLNPSFGLITNFIRDAWTGTLQTVKNPGTFIARMARSAGPKTPLDRLFYAGGGEMATPLGVDIKHFREMRRDIAAKTKADQVRNHLLHGVDSLRELIAFSETYGRRGEFRSVYESEMAQTGDKESALIAAQEAASEVTVNFRRAGVYGRALNQIIPFYNVAIQGPRAGVKAFQRNPTKAFLTATASLTIPALALYALHRDEEWYQEIPLWEKALFLHFKVGEKVIRLPLPFEWGIIFATLPVAAMERWRSGDKQRFEDTAGVMIDGLLPDVLPAGIRQAYEWSANKNLLTGQTLESERLTRLLPKENRYYETTSWAYKQIGKMLGLSPVKIQNTVEGLTGGLSRNFTDVLKERKQTEAADIPIVGRLFSRRLRTGQSVSDVYAEERAASGVYSSILMYLDKGDMKEVEALEAKYKDLLGLDPAGPLEKGNTRERYPRLYKLRDATKLLREAKAMGDTAAATRIARIALGREKAEDYPELGGEE